MTVLTSSPYNLTYNTLVQAEAQAYNVQGWGGLSNANTVGAVIQVPPSQMGQPTRGSATTETQIQVNWNALTGVSTGGSAITSYNLQWDQGNGTYVDLIGQTGSEQTLTTYTQTSGVSAGQTYNF